MTALWPLAYVAVPAIAATIEIVRAHRRQPLFGPSHHATDQRSERGVGDQGRGVVQSHGSVE